MMPHDRSDEFEQNLSRQPVKRIPGEWRADILAAARGAQMSRHGSAVRQQSAFAILSVNQQLDMGKGEARPHPGPLPRGEGETLPAAWRNVALSIQGFYARMVRGNLSQHLSALLWPHPKAWAGLAATWILIAVLNFSTREPSPRLAARAAAPTPATLVELRQQHKLYAELLGRMDTQDADRPRLFPPKPRSERTEILAT
jgi:hypothetical protein